MLRFLAGATAVNYVGSVTTGRQPWQASSFIPFYGGFFKPIADAASGNNVGTSSNRGLPSPAQTTIRLFDAANSYIKNGDPTKLRQWGVRYGTGFAKIPGGVQMNRIWDGVEAIANGGVKDAADRMMFPVTETKDKVRAIWSGPWSTSGGQDYWAKREKPLVSVPHEWKNQGAVSDVARAFPVLGGAFEQEPLPQSEGKFWKRYDYLWSKGRGDEAKQLLDRWKKRDK